MWFIIIVPEWTWINAEIKYPKNSIKLSWTTKSLCWAFQMIMGNIKNLTTLAKHIASNNNNIRFVCDWNCVDLFRLTNNNAIKIKLSENIKTTTHLRSVKFLVTFKFKKEKKKREKNWFQPNNCLKCTCNSHSKAQVEEALFSEIFIHVFVGQRIHFIRPWNVWINQTNHKIQFPMNLFRWIRKIN